MNTNKKEKKKKAPVKKSKEPIKEYDSDDSIVEFNEDGSITLLLYYPKRVSEVTLSLRSP